MNLRTASGTDKLSADIRPESSVSGSFAALADSISVNRRTPATGERPDSCALFSAGNAANQGSGADSACCSELIAMLLPKTSSVFVAIANTRRMSVPIAAVPVP